MAHAEDDETGKLTSLGDPGDLLFTIAEQEELESGRDIVSSRLVCVAGMRRHLECTSN